MKKILLNASLINSFSMNACESKASFEVGCLENFYDFTLELIMKAS